MSAEQGEQKKKVADIALMNEPTNNEEKKEEKKEKKLSDMVERYLEAQKELMEMIVEVFKRFETPLLKKLISE